MALTIRDRAQAVATELAEATDQTMTATVGTAPEARLARLRGGADGTHAAHADRLAAGPSSSKSSRGPILARHERRAGQKLAA